MPDDNRDRVKGLISKGADLAGAAVGGALGFFAAGPAGAAGGALAGTVLKQMLEIGGDICHRTLSPREEMRVGAAYAIAGAAIKERLDRGERLRDDGIFDTGPSNRSAAEEVFEGVLLKCKNEHEEKKLRFISNILANAAFTDVSAADANAILSLAERLTYRQICVLAAVGQATVFPAAGSLCEVQLAQLLRNSRGDLMFTAEVVRLQDSFELTSETFPGKAILTEIGSRCFQLMGLQGVSEVDIEAIIQFAKASAGDMWPAHRFDVGNDESQSGSHRET